MRIGINTFLFTSPFTTQSTRLFKPIKRWGFETVEIPIEQPNHIDPRVVKSRLEDTGLTCGSVCACMSAERDLRGTARQQQIALKYMTQLMDQAKALDCSTVIGPIYSATGRAEAVPRREYQQQWKLVARHLRTLAREAQDRGQRICLEPLNRFETDFINTCEQALNMIEEVDNPALKLMLDTFHMNIEEKNQAAAILRAGKRLAHLHACGCDRGTPGNDHIDWRAIGQALRAINFQGDVVIEGFGSHVKLIARAAAIWRQVEPRQEDIAVKGLKFLQRVL
ncbi:MAG: sugar phosphate isomerase/epimerase family protein [Limisphaerales bacterium]|jgi:D-psicose/D-tagatose/L-ribulose 3-epimerase|nr:sugar phosphate isomerase/epimerase [Verrucomicrobiae bacterium]